MKLKRVVIPTVLIIALMTSSFLLPPFENKGEEIESMRRTDISSTRWYSTERYIGGQKVKGFENPILLKPGESISVTAETLSGKNIPAARLALTWYRSELDLPDIMDYHIENSGSTYMYFKGEPLYPFGYGLSYTSFEYSRLKVRCQEDSVRLSFDLSNSGVRDGEEVVQLYVRFPGDDAAMRLRGFDRVPVPEGETVRVDLVIPFEDLKLWDTEAGVFALARGRYEFMIGASSEDIRLSDSVTL
jgi:beta-glucosidase